MIIHVYTIIRNEEVILPYFIRHYRQFADKIFVYDDGSDDRTTVILLESGVERIPLPFSGLDDINMAQLYGTEYRALSRGIADWVMCVDADELIFHRDVVGCLAGCAKEGAQIVRAQGFQMLSEKPPTTDGQIYDELNMGVQDDRCSKSVVFDPSCDLSFTAGRHATNADAKIKRADPNGLKLLHYRYLGDQYCRDRSARNFARITAENKRYGYGGHNEPRFNGHQGVEWFKKLMDQRVRVV